MPDPEPQSDAKRPSKQSEVIAMLQRPEGATVGEVASVTGVAAPYRVWGLVANLGRISDPGLVKSTVAGFYRITAAEPV